MSSNRLFEIGKFYKHPNANSIRITGKVYSTIYGPVLVAENVRGDLIPIGDHEGAFTGWKEITKEEWFFYFNNSGHKGSKAGANLRTTMKKHIPENEKIKEETGDIMKTPHEAEEKNDQQKIFRNPKRKIKQIEDDSIKW